MYNYGLQPPIPASIRLKRPPLIILNLGIVQEFLVFISPVGAVVMLRLVTNVMNHIVKGIVAYGESAIASLPAEAFVILFVQGLDPFAAVGLDALHEVGQGDGLGQRGKDVDMIADTTDFYGYTIHVADDTSDVGEHLPEVFVAYLHAMILDVEDNMDVVSCE